MSDMADVSSTIFEIAEHCWFDIVHHIRQHLGWSAGSADYHAHVRRPALFNWASRQNGRAGSCSSIHH